MPTREEDFQTVMEADATLMAILTGGVHTGGAAGELGITRETTPDAFDGSGFLKPCALIRQGALVPDGFVRDGMAQVVSVGRTVRVHVYEDSGYANIDAALDRLFVLFEGHQFDSGGFPAELVNRLDRERDTGALSGASLGRIDFFIASVEGG